MGANIKIWDNGNKVEVIGTNNIRGKNVNSKDLRGGASLILEGLIAEGTTTVTDAEYILRGYENLDKKFQSLGANIKLVKE